MSVSPKNTSEQLTKTGNISDFGIDIEEDLIQSVTGKNKNKEIFGTTITGKDSFSSSVKIDYLSIKNFLYSCYEKYSSNEYKKNFDWVDHIAEIKNPNLQKDLNDKLVHKLKNNHKDKLWMAVPEIIQWELVKGFMYKENNFNDIYLQDFLNSLTDQEKTNLNIDFLKKRKIYCTNIENDNPLHAWSIYNCIYCETEVDDKIFLLSNGKWYEIEKNFAKKVTRTFHNLRDKKPDILLPKYNHENENKYNEEISKHNKNFCCMDRKIIQHGGGQGKVEFCDIITKNKEIIHIKRYGSSSVLSHLFAQGLVSGELFLRDEEFRNKVNKKLDVGFKISNTRLKPDASKYKIIFGIISLSKEKLEIPFFSKVGLRTAVERLKTFGYEVYLTKIESQKS